MLAYGNARELCLGVEVVLPTGEVLDDLRKLKKDNTGYDLKNLFVGAKGTLGIITAAMLKLFPQPVADMNGVCSVASPDAALELFVIPGADGVAADGVRADAAPASVCEFMLRHAPGARDAARPAPIAWYCARS